MRNTARACGRNGLGVTMSTPSCNSKWATVVLGECVPILKGQRPGQVNARHRLPASSQRRGSSVAAARFFNRLPRAGVRSRPDLAQRVDGDRLAGTPEFGCQTQTVGG